MQVVYVVVDCRTEECGAVREQVQGESSNHQVGYHCGQLGLSSPGKQFWGQSVLLSPFFPPCLPQARPLLGTRMQEWRVGEMQPCLPHRARAVPAVLLGKPTRSAGSALRCSGSSSCTWRSSFLPVAYAVAGRSSAVEADFLFWTELDPIPNLYVEALTSDVTELGDRALRLNEVIG